MPDNGYVVPLKSLDDLRDGYSLIDVWKNGCRACEQLKPVIEEFAKKYYGIVNCYEINVNDMLDLVPKFKIQSFPYLLLFRNKNFLGGFTGARFSGGIGTERAAINLENLEKAIKRWTPI